MRTQNIINLPSRRMKTLQILKEPPTVLRVCERVFVQCILVSHLEPDQTIEERKHELVVSALTARETSL